MVYNIGNYFASGAIMRGHKWKMLEVAMNQPEVTSRDFAEATGIAAPQCWPYAHSLEKEGYLKLDREVPLERGGRPMKIYVWTGKHPDDGSAVPTSMWGKADSMLNACFTAMVRCREKGDESLASAV